MSVKVISGVNEMNVELAGQTIAEVIDTTSALLHLDGEEQVKVNGSDATSSTVVHDGDSIEFVKVSGEKGSVDISSGVNSMALDVAGQTVATVVDTVKSILNLDGEEEVKVNGSEADANYVVQDGDSIEFVKASGEKGAVTVTVVSGVNECTIAADGDIMDIIAQVKEPLNLEGNESLRVNGQEVDNSYIPQDGDKVELTKSAGEKGLLG